MDILSKLKGYGASKQQNGDVSAPSQSIVGKVLDVNKTSYAIRRLIATGGYSFVYEVDSRGEYSGSKRYAMKIIQVHDDEAYKVVKREVKVMKSLPPHENIVLFKDAEFIRNMRSSTSQALWEVRIVMEYCPGSVIDIMNRRSNAFSEVEILRIFHDMLEATLIMHTHSKGPYFHRDLKVENLLVGDDGRYKLCDFGSIYLRVPHLATSNDIALVEVDIQKYTTMAYRSPEMIDLYLRKPVFLPADIWALGCVLYKLCYYKSPFEDGGPLQILNCKYRIPDEPNYTKEVKNLIQYLLNPDCEDRPHIVQTLEACEAISGSPPANPKYLHLRKNFLENLGALRHFMRTETTGSNKGMSNLERAASMVSLTDEEDFADFENMGESESPLPPLKKKSPLPPSKKQIPPELPSNSEQKSSAAESGASQVLGEGTLFSQLDWMDNSRGEDSAPQAKEDIPSTQQEVEVPKQAVDAGETDGFGDSGMFWEAEENAAAPQPQEPKKKTVLDFDLHIPRTNKELKEHQPPEWSSNVSASSGKTSKMANRRGIDHPVVEIERNIQKPGVKQSRSNRQQATHAGQQGKIQSIAGRIIHAPTHIPHPTISNAAEKYVGKVLVDNLEPPKAKYIRKLILAAWAADSKQKFTQQFFAAINKKDVDKNAVIAFKAVTLIHRMLFEGFKELSSLIFLSKLRYLKLLRNSWRKRVMRSPRTSPKSGLVSRVYAGMMEPYLTFLLERVRFFHLNQFFEGNYSLEMSFEKIKKDGGKIVLGSEQPMDMITLIGLQKIMAKILRLMEFMNNTDGKGPSRSAIACVINDAYNNHVAQTFILVRLAKRAKLEPFKNIIIRYYKDFETTKVLMNEILEIDGMDSLTSVPKFPKKPLDFRNPRSLPLVRSPPSIFFTADMNGEDGFLESENGNGIGVGISMDDETSDEEQPVAHIEQRGVPNGGADAFPVSEEFGDGGDLFDNDFGRGGPDASGIAGEDNFFNEDVVAEHLDAMNMSSPRFGISNSDQAAKDELGEDFGKGDLEGWAMNLF